MYDRESREKASGGSTRPLNTVVAALLTAAGLFWFHTDVRLYQGSRVIFVVSVIFSFKMRTKRIFRDHFNSALRIKVKLLFTRLATEPSF